MIMTETVPNPHMLVYHVRKRLVEGDTLHFSHRDWNALERADRGGGLVRFLLSLLWGKGAREYKSREYEEYQKCAPLADDLFAIEGIEEVWIGTYEITLTKGHAFNWKELDPQISVALSKHGLEE